MQLYQIGQKENKTPVVEIADQFYKNGQELSFTTNINSLCSLSAFSATLLVVSTHTFGVEGLPAVTTHSV